MSDSVERLREKSELATLRARVVELEARASEWSAAQRVFMVAEAERDALEARVAELEGANRYLTERVDAAGELLEQCEAAEGRRLERAAIVADLRVRASEQRSWTGESTEAAVLRAYADRYENGEHERKGT